jgi:hypothetical protein
MVYVIVSSGRLYTGKLTYTVMPLAPLFTQVPTLKNGTDNYPAISFIHCWVVTINTTVL